MGVPTLDNGDSKEKKVKEACTFDEATQTVKYCNDVDNPSIVFQFCISRQKSCSTNKERLVITAKEADNTLMGEITTTVPNLQEGLLALREYGVVASRAMYGKIAKCIEQNYLLLNVDKIEFEQALTENVLIDILRMIKDYIEDCKAEGRDYESLVNDKACYNIPVADFSDIIKDSEFNIFELSELKRELKTKGHTICSTGRYDRTIYNGEKKKAEKVISLSKDCITALPELPQEKLT